MTKILRPSGSQPKIILHADAIIIYANGLLVESCSIIFMLRAKMILVNT
jgi:hypothetical protein